MMNNTFWRIIPLDGEGTTLRVIRGYLQRAQVTNPFTRFSLFLNGGTPCVTVSLEAAARRQPDGAVVAARAMV